MVLRHVANELDKAEHGNVVKIKERRFIEDDRRRKTQKAPAILRLECVEFDLKSMVIDIGVEDWSVSRFYYFYSGGVIQMAFLLTGSYCQRTRPHRQVEG